MNREKTKLCICLPLIIGVVLALGALIVISFGFVHLAEYFSQPVFIGLDGTEAVSQGFLIISGFFFGFGAFVLIIGIALLGLAYWFHRQQKHKV